MQKTTTMTLALSAVAAVAVALGPATSRAQSRAPSAAHVAAQVQAFYDQTRTVRTAFYQAHYDRIYQRTTRSRGVLTIARPGKLRFDYLGGDGKVVVSDGSTFTLYEPGDDGGPGQYARSAVRREGVPSALGFLTGQSRLDRDFTFRLRDAQRFRWDGHVLELRPRRERAAYRRVFLFVDDDPAAAGVVRRVLIQDHDGNLNRFDFRRMRFNRPVAASRFDFAPPRGARPMR
ncbi:MAG TPA: outer membrane lipoprotein carrier protein LolA [Sandaracinaceae bacterium LLY-WYZ-13_1]|nr:outer membrane lipoprotein carrier protein LolA [Sandaracinaceae bacterium LLY-WYZ-13_1]